MQACTNRKTLSAVRKHTNPKFPELSLHWIRQLCMPKQQAANKDYICSCFLLECCGSLHWPQLSWFQRALPELQNWIQPLRYEHWHLFYSLNSFVLPWRRGSSHLHPLNDRGSISVTEGWQFLSRVLSHCHPWAATSLRTPPPCADVLNSNPRSLTYPILLYTRLWFR